MKEIILLVFMAILFSSCPKVSSINYNLGESIMVHLNSPVAIASEEISILLTAVQEGRCPKDVNCIQAGEAIASIDFAVGDAVSTIQLKCKGLCMNETGSCGSTAMAQGYKIQLFFIYPYPNSNPPSGKDFTAKIMVTKNKTENF